MSLFLSLSTREMGRWPLSMPWRLWQRALLPASWHGRSCSSLTRVRNDWYVSNTYIRTVHIHYRQMECVNEDVCVCTHECIQCSVFICSFSYDMCISYTYKCYFPSCFLLTELSVLRRLLGSSSDEMVTGNAALCLAHCFELEGAASSLLGTDIVPLLLRHAAADAERTALQRNAAIALGKLCRTEPRCLHTTLRTV